MMHTIENPTSEQKPTVYTNPYLIPIQPFDFLLNSGHTDFLKRRHPRMNLLAETFPVFNEEIKNTQDFGIIRIPQLVQRTMKNNMREVLLHVMNMEFRYTPLQNILKLAAVEGDTLQPSSPYVQMLEQIYPVELERANAATLFIDSLPNTVSIRSKHIAADTQRFIIDITTFHLPQAA